MENVLKFGCGVLCKDEQRLSYESPLSVGVVPSVTRSVHDDLVNSLIQPQVGDVVVVVECFTLTKNTDTRSLLCDCVSK